VVIKVQNRLLITLRAARVNNGFILQEVAELVGKSKDTISKYEADSSNIPRNLMTELLRLYGLTQNDIFFGKESDFIGERNKSKQKVNTK
jgi:transcriptional regulator with XRE-family HTH domain